MNSGSFNPVRQEELVLFEKEEPTIIRIPRTEEGLKMANEVLERIRMTSIEMDQPEQEAA